MTTADVNNTNGNDTSCEKRSGIIFIARHGERMDYAFRDYQQRNWVMENFDRRPWDPPLTAHGRRQGREMGKFIRSLCQQHQAKMVTTVYSSPFLRCCMTARESIVGMQSPLKVQVEEGLIETLSSDWFKSWCLDGISDGSWGGGNFVRRKDSSGGIHHLAKKGISSMLSTVENIDKRLLKAEAATGGVSVFYDENTDPLGGTEGTDTDQNGENHQEEKSAIDFTYRKSAVPVTTEYRWGAFEKHRDQMDRLTRLSKTMIERHAGESILLLSHGGPVTHWFEALFPDRPWREFGHCKYASCSMYRWTIVGDEVKWESLVLNNNSYLQVVNEQHAEELETSNGIEF